MTSELGLSHVVMHVSDIERTKEFYSTLFGWTEVFDRKLEGPEFSSSVNREDARVHTVGGTIGYLRLEFVQTSWTVNARPTPSLGVSCLSFQVEDIDQFHRAVIAADGVPESEPRSFEGTALFFMSDLDGQMLEIVEYSPESDAWGGVGRGPHPLLRDH